MDKLTEVIITCKGKADDPDIQEKISGLLQKVSSTSGAGTVQYIDNKVYCHITIPTPK